MGIKGKVLIAVGTGLVLAVAGWLGLRKEEDERSEKIQGMIRDVDLKEPEKKEEVKEEPKTVEEITADVDEAINGMGIAGDVETTQVTDEKSTDQLLQETSQMLEDYDKRQEELREQQEAAYKAAAEEAARKREERQANGEWLKDVQKAVEAKSYGRLEDILNEKYNPYPYHPAPASPFGQAYHEGVIDEKIYEGAKKYYGRLWDYSGD